MFLVGVVSGTLHSRTRGTRQSQTKLQAWNKPVPVDPALLAVGSIPALPLEKTSHGMGLSCPSLLERLQLARGRAGGAACSGASSCSPEPFQKGSMLCARPDSCGQENGAQGMGLILRVSPKHDPWWGLSLLPANERQHKRRPRNLSRCLGVAHPFSTQSCPKHNVLHR